MTTLLHQANTEDTSKPQTRLRSVFVFLFKLLVLWPLYIVLGYYFAWAVIYVFVAAIAQLSA